MFGGGGVGTCRGRNECAWRRTYQGAALHPLEKEVLVSVSFDQASLLVQHHTSVLDVDLEHVGVLAQVYLHDETNEPLWAAVVFDQPADVETVVPIHDAHVDADDLMTNYPRSLIESGPRIAAGDDLPWLEEERLRDHYGQNHPAAGAPVVVPISDVTTAR